MNKSLLCYCIQIIFTSSVRIRNAWFVLAWVGFKQDESLGFVFPREFSSLFRVSRGRFHALLWKLCWLASLSRDVTGKALLSSEVVEFVILWCYVFGTVLDFFGWFRCESPAGRHPGQPCARWSAQLRVQEHKRVARERRERARALARRFKLFAFGHRPQAAGPIRVSVWGGAPPTSRLAGVEFKFWDIASLLGKINLSTFIHV